MNHIQQEVFNEINKIEPVWSGLTKVSNLLPPNEKILLHAGPPFKKFSDIPLAVQNSLIIGILYEKWASTIEEAAELISSQKISLKPAQDYNIVVPLAGVASPSMTLIIVSDANNPTHKKYSVHNEGMTLCTRLGILNLDIVNHLTWLHGDFSKWLEVRFNEPIPLAPIIQESLLNGDDCHGRTIYGSEILVKKIYQQNPNDIPEECRNFLNSALAFSLNYWMATASLLMSKAEEYPNSLYITKVGGNGYEFGIQTSQSLGQWIVEPAPKITGIIEPKFSHLTVLDAIGDSPVVDFMGLGGQVLDLASQSIQALRDSLPEDCKNRGSLVLKGRLKILGNRYGITDINNMLEHQCGPLVLLGMIESSGVAGRIGGGVLDTPIDLIKNMLGK